MSHKWWALGAVACGTFMATLDSSIVNIALPTLSQEFSSPLPGVKWVVVIYLIAISCLILPAGRLSDQLGRGRTLVLGFTIFTLGSLLCGMAPRLGALIFFRLIQGAGAALLMANGPAVITAAFPKSERGGALGTMGMVVSAGLVSGPALGGLLIGHLGWRSIFWINLPVGLAGLVLAARYIEQGFGVGSRFRFDWKGALLQALILLLFLAAFDPPSIRYQAVFSILTELRLVSFALAVGLFVLFLRVESKAEAPLFDSSLIKIRSFWMSNVASFLTFISYSTVSVLMPFFLQRVLNLNPQDSGWMMTLIPLTIFVIAPVSGRLSDRFGTAGLSALGALVGGVTLLAFAGFFGPGIHSRVDLSHLGVGLALIGLATGMFQSPNNSAIMSAVPTDRLGVASALLATIRNLGMVVGTGLSTALFGWRYQVNSDFTTAMQFTCAISASAAFLAAFVSFLRGR